MWRRRVDRASVTGRVPYRFLMSDNMRWDALEFREGDIVICSPSKCGMTWTQRLVSLLVFDGPDLPGPLSMVSPWLDQTIQPIEEVVATLDAQEHRRFIKTHTPFDGLVLDERVSYIGVGRDPRDAAVSMLFQATNVDQDRMRALREAMVPPHQPAPPPHEAGPPPHRAAPPPHGAVPPPPHGAPPPHEQFAHPGEDVDRDQSPREAFRDWMDRPIMPPEGIGSLATILHHFNSFWHRRHLPNVALFHYADFQDDLVGEVVRLGEVLGFDLSRNRAVELAQHATLDAMRARASQLVPNGADGVWRSNARFFRAGGRGEWRQIMTEHEHRRYIDLAHQLAPSDLLAWAHEGRRGTDPST